MGETSMSIIKIEKLSVRTLMWSRKIMQDKILNMKMIILPWAGK